MTHTAKELEAQWQEGQRVRAAELKNLHDANGNPKHPPSDMEWHRQNVETQYKQFVRDLTRETETVVKAAQADLRKAGLGDPTTRLSTSQLEKASAMLPLTMTDFATLDEGILAERCQMIADTADQPTRVAYFKAAQHALVNRFNTPGRGVQLNRATKALEDTVVDVKLRDAAQAEIQAARSLQGAIGAQDYRERRQAEFERGVREQQERQQAAAGRPRSA